MSIYITDKLPCSGAYAPLTIEGNMMVDGVLASCYAFTDHDLAHIVMTPIQWYPQTIQWIFGDDGGFSAFIRTTNSYSPV